MAGQLKDNISLSGGRRTGHGEHGQHGGQNMKYMQNMRGEHGGQNRDGVDQNRVGGQYLAAGKGGEGAVVGTGHRERWTHRLFVLLKIDGHVNSAQLYSIWTGVDD